jgi:hypothetical protein
VSRDPAILLWPEWTFRPQQASKTIDRPLFKGPKPLDGREQVVATSAGGWLISYDAIPIYDVLYGAFSALWVQLAAKGRPIYVRPDLLAATPAPTLVTFSDGSTYSDGGRLAQATGDCSLLAPAARGATVISVTNSVANPRTVGSFFEINGRAHIIDAIDGISWSIWPALRADYPAGTVLEVDDPRVLAYLTSDSKATVMNTDARQLTLMSFQFTEAGWL